MMNDGRAVKKYQSGTVSAKWRQFLRAQSCSVSLWVFTWGSASEVSASSTPPLYLSSSLSTYRWHLMPLSLPRTHTLSLARFRAIKSLHIWHKTALVTIGFPHFSPDGAAASWDERLLTQPANHPKVWKFSHFFLTGAAWYTVVSQWIRDNLEIIPLWNYVFRIKQKRFLQAVYMEKFAFSLAASDRNVHPGDGCCHASSCELHSLAVFKEWLGDN